LVEITRSCQRVILYNIITLDWLILACADTFFFQNRFIQNTAVYKQALAGQTTHLPGCIFHLCAW